MTVAAYALRAMARNSALLWASLTSIQNLAELCCRAQLQKLASLSEDPGSVDHRTMIGAAWGLIRSAQVT